MPNNVTLEFDHIDKKNKNNNEQSLQSCSDVSTKDE